MPPSGKLKDAEIAALAEWIEMGAPWGAPPDTSTQRRPRRSIGPSFRRASRKLPDVRDAAWAKSPIDRFVLAALEGKGLKPAPAADKRDADPPRYVRPHRPAAHARRNPRLPGRRARPTPSPGWSTACWPRRTTASAGGATGWTSPAMPIPTVSMRTWSTATPSAIAIT